MKRNDVNRNVHSFSNLSKYDNICNRGTESTKFQLQCNKQEFQRRNESLENAKRHMSNDSKLQVKFKFDQNTKKKQKRLSNIFRCKIYSNH